MLCPMPFAPPSRHLARRRNLRVRPQVLDHMLEGACMVNCEEYHQ
jgi:hypothetical protein